MNRQNSRLPFTLFAVLLSLSLIVIPPLLVQAQSNPNTVFKPPGSGAPDDTRGAGSRDGGRCAEDEFTEGVSRFQVFMPIYSQTSVERPTFSVYIPRTMAKKLFFSLKDAKEDYYYETTISLPSQAGRFSLKLPADAPGIETNKEYTWSLGLVCKQIFDPNDPMLQGVIQKVQTNRAI